MKYLQLQFQRVQSMSIICPLSQPVSIKQFFPLYDRFTILFISFPPLLSSHFIPNRTNQLRKMCETSGSIFAYMHFALFQRHMPYFRRRMVYEILTKKLL